MAKELTPEEKTKLKNRAKQAGKDAVNALVVLTAALQSAGADQAEPVRELTEIIKQTLSEYK